jgi:hypothetical protein
MAANSKPPELRRVRAFFKPQHDAPFKALKSQIPSKEFAIFFEENWR